MKHAIIILIHKELECVNRLILYFKYNCDIFIHIDKKCDVSDDFVKIISNNYNVKQIYRKYNVNWGGFSILKTEYYLLKKIALYGIYDYVHILSGQDYPIRPFCEFYNFFEMNKNSDFIQYVNIPNSRWDRNSFSRFQYFYLFDWFKSRTKAQKYNCIIKKTQNIIGFKRNVPSSFDKLYGGSQWFSLSISSVMSIIEYTQKHIKFYKRMKYTFAPEEIYFQTVLLNINNNQTIIPLNKRYIRWKYENGNRPANLDASHFRYLITSNCLFARKMQNNVSESLLKLVDDYLLNDNNIYVMENGGWAYDGYLKYNYSEQFIKTIQHLKKHLDINSIMDIGCGSGIYVAELRERGISVDGFDANPFTPQLSSYILNNNPELCRTMDLVENINLNKSYDFVYCKDVLPYIPSNKIENALKNLNQLTNKYLLVSWYQTGNSDRDGIHYEAMKEGNVINIFQSYGFYYNEEYSKLIINMIGDSLNNKYYFFKKE